MPSEDISSPEISPLPVAQGQSQNSFRGKPPQKRRFSEFDIAIGVPVAIVFDIVALLEVTDPFLGAVEFWYYKKKGFKTSIAGVNVILNVIIKLIPILNFFPWYLISFLVMVFLDRSPEAEKYFTVIGKVSSLKSGGDKTFSTPSGPSTVSLENESSRIIETGPSRSASLPESGTVQEAQNGSAKEAVSPERSGRPAVTEKDFGMPEENPLTEAGEEELDRPFIKNEFAERRRKKEGEEEEVAGSKAAEKKVGEEQRKKDEDLEERLDTGTAELRHIKRGMEDLSIEENSDNIGETVDLRKSA